jgi:hypothetical protein
MKTVDYASTSTNVIITSADDGVGSGTEIDLRGWNGFFTNANSNQYPHGCGFVSCDIYKAGCSETLD